MSNAPHVERFDANIHERIQALVEFLRPHAETRQNYFYQFEIPPDTNCSPQLIIREYRNELGLAEERTTGVSVFVQVAGAGVYVPGQEMTFVSSRHGHGLRLIMVDVRGQILLTSVQLSTPNEALCYRPADIISAISRIENEYLRTMAIIAITERAPTSYTEFLDMMHRLHRQHAHLLSPRADGRTDYSHFEL